MDLAASLKYRSHPSSHSKYLAKHHIGFLKRLYTSSKLVFRSTYQSWKAFASGLSMGASRLPTPASLRPSMLMNTTPIIKSAPPCCPCI